MNEEELNGKNIIVARESRGITQKQLSEKVKGLSQGNLSRMEKGLLNISDEIIIQISQVLDYPVSFFYKEINTSRDDTLFYRKRVTMTQKTLLRLEARVNILCAIVDNLLESIDIPLFNIPHASMKNGRTANEVAFNLRNILNIPSGPIGNVVSKLEKHGVILLFIEMDDKFDGLTKFTTKAQPVMFINAKISDDRKRFTIAHELGHLVMHLREVAFETDEKIAEIQANEFAAEFLMPANDCRNDLRLLKYNDLPSLKLYWKVSKAAIIRRAYDLKYITENTYRYYLMTLNKNGERIKERELIQIEKPVIFKKLVQLHLTELGYTESEIEIFLGVKFEELSNTADMFKNSKLRIVV